MAASSNGGKSNPPIHLRGIMYFAVPSSILDRQHLIGFEFDGLEEWSALHSWGISRGYLPALPPQAPPSRDFDASMKQTRGRVQLDDNGGGDFDENGAPLCPVHGGDGAMLESRKYKGGYYCGRSQGGARCGWEWNNRRGFYQITGKGAARR